MVGGVAASLVESVSVRIAFATSDRLLDEVDTLTQVGQTRCASDGYR